MLVLGGLVIAGHWYASLTPLGTLLLFVAPLGLWLGELPVAKPLAGLAARAGGAGGGRSAAFAGHRAGRPKICRRTPPAATEKAIMNLHRIGTAKRPWSAADRAAWDTRSRWSWPGKGPRVAIAARGQEQLDAAAAELRALSAETFAIQADVSRQADVDRLVDETVARFGRLDLLVNAVGRSARERRCRRRRMSSRR